jgi:hypothetical protein
MIPDQRCKTITDALAAVGLALAQWIEESL